MSTIHELFEEQVSLNPHRIAISFLDKKITYQELNEKANQLSHFLKRIEPDTLVALCLDRSDQMIVAILAVLKAGGAYVPIDPKYPRERIHYILKNSECSLILTEEKYKNILEGSATAIHSLDTLNVLENYPIENPVSKVSSDRLAYVIYTSGTTGYPKGVLQTHHNVCRLFHTTNELFGFSQNDVWTLFHSYAFDFSVWEIWGALLYGGKLVIVPDSSTRDFIAFYRLCQKEQITVLNQTPTSFSSFSEVGQSEEKLHSLRYVIFGGEQLKMSLLEPWIKKYGLTHPKLINMYGITETTVHATYQEINSRDVSIRSNSIGKVLSDLTPYILDENGNLAEEGELYLGGEGLARGYLKNTDLTNERFLANPFQTPSEKEEGKNFRIYKTGDLVRLLPDNELEYLGRKDFQVKIRGYRIELGEIENVMCLYPEIHQAKVLVKGQDENKQLIGYYVSKQPLNEQTLLEHLQNKLPQPLVPAVLIHLTQFPLTVNGKLDETSLPVWTRANEVIGPRTTTERRLQEIWKDLLADRVIGIKDSFFKLGGNSLLAMKLAVRIRKEFSQSISYAAILKNQTIENLAIHLDGHSVVEDQIESLDVKQEEQVLSSNQEGLWFLQTLDETNHAYHIPLVYKLCQFSSVELLKRRINTLVSRHEILRSWIKQDESGKAYQLVGSAELLLVEDITCVNFDDFQFQLKNHLNHPFDLSSEYPLKVLFFRVEKEIYLAAIFHHIAFDGWSVEIFLDELRIICRNQIDLLPTLDLQFKDYASWQKKRLPITHSREAVYWKKKFDGYQLLNLTYDFKRPAQIDYSGNTIHFELNAEISKQLRALASDLNVTLYSVLLSGYCLLLKLYSGQNEVILGTPLANRQRPGVEHLIGYFVNSLPLRIEIAPRETVRDLIQRIGQEILDLQLHQDLPLEKLIEILKVPKDVNRNPLFEVMFGVQSFVNQGIPDLLEPYDCSHLYNAAKFDLSTFLDDGGDCLKGEFNYRTSLFEKATISHYIDTYLHLLTQIAQPDHLSVPVEELSSITKTQLENVETHWNQTDRPFASEKGIHELFEEQVIKYSDQLAVSFNHIKITYKELNEKANQLAHYLRSTYAIQPDTLVAVCLERSEQMIIAILGILKAGAAYVPIDVQAPDERIQFILNDTSPKVVLVNTHHKERIAKLTSFPILAPESEEFLQQSKANLQQSFSSNQLAYVIYTSGTSGKPKGVLIEHQGVVNFISYYIEKYQFNSKDAISQYLSCAFDAAGSEIYSALLSGASLHIVPESIRLDAKELGRFIEDNHITFSVFPPAILGDLPIFREPIRMIVMGDSCPQTTFEKWVSAGHQLINGYGPTEATIGSIETDFYQKGAIRNQVIGRPISNRKVYILDDKMRCQPVGVPGEIYLGGIGIARGYLNQPQLTQEKFIPDPFGGNSLLYKTGDLGRWLPNGEIEFIGRNDSQVKIRGYRIELLEVENALLKIPEIKQGAVIVKERPQGKSLFAYYVADDVLDEDSIKNALRKILPDYMIPASIIYLEKLPLTINGKLDTKALPEGRQISNKRQPSVQSNLENALLQAWGELLERDVSTISIEDNFFDVGGNSLLILRLKAKVETLFDKRKLKVTDFFKYPTIKSFCQHIEPKIPPSTVPSIAKNEEASIAVIGISGAFPRAQNLDEYWDCLINGKECLDHLTLEQCGKLGISDEIVNHANFFPVEGIVSEIDQFDPSFWQLSFNDASAMDPQIRKFLEHAWIALENSGEIVDRNKKKIGVFAGAGAHSYEGLRSDWEARTMSKDFLATRLSYLLGLTGPSLNINTACSTSLVAIVEAYKNLVLDTCEIAIAGGVSFNMPENYGYTHQEGLIFSNDGHCKVFDQQSSGTVRGSGIGVVILKRLEHAIRDNNPILAVIKGYASNNDGNRKVGFTAPSTVGQTECILEAQRMAKVSSDQINFVECHGTGTPLGDPIEVQALADAFDENSFNKNYQCQLGSVKANIGHTDSAAGVAGFLKVCLMLKHQKIPQQIHFQNPNPALNLKETGFEISSVNKEWTVNQGKRVAGVSSFGIGGTNAHVILEEYSPETITINSSENEWVVLTLSAKSHESLREYCKKLRHFIQNKRDLNLRDVAYTLQHKRDHFNERLAFACRNRDDALAILQTNLAIIKKGKDPEIIFMFPGQGSQYAGMARALYQKEPIFKQHLEECCSLISIWTKCNFLDLLYHKEDSFLHQTQFAQPALFAISYALAKLLEHYGIHPRAYIGHSTGEYVAAVLSGVFTLQEAIQILVKRAQLMQQMHKGVLLSVQSSSEKIAAILPKTLEICVYNSASHVVIGGTESEIALFKQTLDSLNVPNTILHTSHAFHTQMMNDAAEQFEKYLGDFKFKRPDQPFYSNVTGETADEEVTTSSYWADHLRQPVKFAQGIENIKRQYKNPLFVEVGPGKSLTLFAGSGLTTLQTAKEFQNQDDGGRTFYQALAKLWCHGCFISWPTLGKIAEIPPYQFEKIRCWIEPAKKEVEKRVHSLCSTLNWESRKRLSLVKRVERQVYLVFKDQIHVLDTSIQEWRHHGSVVYEVDYDFAVTQIVVSEHHIVLNPTLEEHYESLASFLKDKNIDTIVHGWLLSRSDDEPQIDFCQYLGFYHLYLLQAHVLHHLPHLTHLVCVANGIHQVTGDDSIHPVKGTVVGALRTLSNELQIKVSLLDAGFEFANLLNGISYLQQEPHYALDLNFAIRAGHVWQEKKEMISLEKIKTPLLSDGDVIMISGGLGGIGLAIAKEISKKHKVTFLLVSRNATPNVYQEKALNVIAANGCTTDLINCDLSDRQALEQVLQQAECKWGTITIVIHAAGVPAVNIADRNLQTIKDSLRGKVAGGHHLLELVKNKPLKIFAMTSSLASVIGDIGRIDYSASNSYLDVLSGLVRPFKLLSINWPGWSSVGMSQASSQYDENSVTESEGAELFYKLLNQTEHNQIIVSKVDLAQIQAKLKNSLPEKENKLVDDSLLVEKETTFFEKKIAQLYSQILGCKTFSKFDSYFELGGNSLSAIRLIHLLKKEFQKSIAMETLYRDGSVHSLARHYENSLQATSSFVSLEKTSFEKLSFAQERLWFIEKYEGGSNAYNIPLIFEIPAKAEESIQLSIQSIVKRHEVLRSFIREDMEGNGIQIVDEEDLFQIQRKNCQDHAQFQQGLKQDINHIFDLTKEYPIKVTFYKCGSVTYLGIIVHHIAFDGWSIDLFMNELELYYRYFSGKTLTPPELPKLTMQYKDFARWQREFLKGKHLNKQLDYWKNKLQDYEILQLETDRKRPAKVDYQGNTLFFEINKNTSDKLRDLSKNANVTLYSILLSGFFLLIKTYTQQNDLIIGTPIANRHYEGVENLIGFFVNSIVMRLQINSSETLTELIKKVSGEVIEAQLNQDLPFERLVEELKIEKDLSRHPLFQVMFGVQHFAKKLPWKGYDVEGSLYQVAKFDISTFIDDANECLSGSFNYRISLFDESTIQEWISNYVNILTRLTVENPQISVGDFLLNLKEKTEAKGGLSPKEYRQIIEEWNKTDWLEVNDIPIHQRFEEQAGLHPNQVALICEHSSLTYRELNEKANQLAHYLIIRGIKRDVLVGVCLDRNEHMIIALLAILKAGGAYVPLDPSYSEERMSYMVEDSSLKLVLTQEAHRENYSGAWMDLFVPLDGVNISSQVTALSVCNPSVELGGSDLAYVLYTSGTTGRPKGVMIEHHSFAITLEAIRYRFFKDYQIINTYSLTSYTFDIFGLEYTLTLCTGGTLTLGTKDFTSLDCRNYHFIQMTPSLAELKLEELNETNHLILMVGGEQLSPELFDKIKTKSHAIAHVYGPTETTIWSTASTSQNIGKPLFHETVYILDKDLFPLPVGEKGDLYIGGAGVARGYLNKPELTKEKFIPNPFQSDEEKCHKKNATLYKTGDLARWLPSGELEFLGREDFQVKIKGHRIELGEVESALASHPDIHQAIVVAKGQSLIGYYKASKQLSNNELLAHLVQKIPTYMIPDSFCFIEEWPLTLAGKIDRSQLPEVQVSHNLHTEPQNETQKVLREIWGDLLKVPLTDIGIQDSFFNLGGNSLSVIKLVRKVNQSFGSSLSISDAFIFRTIEKLSERLLQETRAFELLVPLNQSFDKPILFMIHPAAGGCEVYASLANALEGSFFCCGVDSHNLYEDHKIDNLHELAQYYLEKMDEKMSSRSQKVYHLLGWSLGGKIALEMATILEQRALAPEIKLYLIDPVLYENFKAEMESAASPEEQMNGYREYAEKEGHEKNFIEKVIANMNREQQMSEQPISAVLRYSDITLFKATEKDTRFHSFERLSCHVLRHPYNYLDKHVHNPSSIELIHVKDSHHGNILKQDTFITTQITKGK